MKGDEEKKLTPWHLGCEVIEATRRCGSLEDITCAGIDKLGVHVYWCRAHYEQKRPKKDHEIWIETMAKQQAAICQQQGLKASEVAMEQIRAKLGIAPKALEIAAANAKKEEELVV